MEAPEQPSRTMPPAALRQLLWWAKNCRQIKYLVGFTTSYLKPGALLPQRLRLLFMRAP